MWPPALWWGGRSGGGFKDPPSTGPLSYRPRSRGLNPLVERALARRKVVREASKRVEVTQRFARLSEPLPQPSQIEMGVRILGVGRERPLVCGRRRVRTLEVFQRDSQIERRGGVVGSSHECLAIVRLGLGQLTRLV